MNEQAQQRAVEHGRYPDLAGKTAIVTGGSRGIGAATAVALAANGVAVAVVGRDEAALAGVVERINNAIAGGPQGGGRARAGRAIWVAADLTDPEAAARMVAAVTDQLGPADILAAFAGGNGAPVPTEQETPEHWRAVIDSDLNSMFYTVRAVIPAMIERGRGSIVTMSSSAGRQAAQSAAAYAAAKAAVLAFTRHLAGEMAAKGIRANCLAPAAVENDKMRKWMTDEQRNALGASFPLGRLGQPEDVAAAALFLASDASSWITGQTLDISGGKIML